MPESRLALEIQPFRLIDFDYDPHALFGTIIHQSGSTMLVIILSFSAFIILPCMFALRGMFSPPSTAQGGIRICKGTRREMYSCWSLAFKGLVCHKVQSPLEFIRILCGSRSGRTEASTLGPITFLTISYLLHLERVLARVPPKRSHHGSVSSNCFLFIHYIHILHPFRTFHPLMRSYILRDLQMPPGHSMSASGSIRAELVKMIGSQDAEVCTFGGFSKAWVLTVMSLGLEDIRIL
ncbi:hypothetical protein BKA70DRAFT_665597 [Coprinopsis sp. MPI-PUGE-AT-0042]|nr:hypothetical protein BKA70DRAFT_665597 [Coprinopsis sp. MPI-PUGE-AT-0042]